MVLALPEVSFDEKENILSEEKEKILSLEKLSNEQIITQNSKLFINLCNRLKLALEDIQKCMRTYGFFNSIDIEISEEYVNLLLNKIRNMLNSDEICDIIDQISEDVMFLENFCKNKNVKKLDETLIRIEQILENLENLENF